MSFAVADLPPPIEGPSAWYGPEMAKRNDWILTLTPAEVAEVEAATRPLAAREADIAQLSRSDFPLPTLAPKLRRILGDVLDGRGFTLIRGLPVERWSMRESATAARRSQPAVLMETFA